MSLGYEDGVFVGQVARDSVTHLGEHFGDDARIEAVVIVLVVKDGEGIHISYNHEVRE
jgi:hypothetical protein